MWHLPILKGLRQNPHRRLLSKLRSHGVNDDIILRLPAVLCDRKQRFVINGVMCVNVKLG